MGSKQIEMRSGLCKWLLVLSLVVASAVSAPTQLPGEDSTPRRFEFVRLLMGTSIQITLYCSDKPTANHAANTAFGRMAELVDMLSDYDPHSELNDLCRDSGPGQPVSVSADLFHVLEESLRISRLSDGAFDVTVGPLTRLWRRTRREGRLPSADELALAGQAVGFQHVKLTETDSRVELQRPGMQLDLGGIAKGYIADQGLLTLNTLGIERALIDAGGDIVAGEPPPGLDGWRIGIAPLEGSPDQPAQFLLLRNAAVATSGDAVKFAEIDGVRYSHILDPATGRGLTTHSSVTVIAPTGLKADAWASALNVLVPRRGLELMEQEAGMSAWIVWQSGNQLESTQSAGFAAYLTP